MASEWSVAAAGGVPHCVLGDCVEGDCPNRGLNSSRLTVCAAGLCWAGAGDCPGVYTAGSRVRPGGVLTTAGGNWVGGLGMRLGGSGPWNSGTPKRCTFCCVGYRCGGVSGGGCDSPSGPVSPDYACTLATKTRVLASPARDQHRYRSEWQVACPSAERRAADYHPYAVLPAGVPLTLVLLQRTATSPAVTWHSRQNPVPSAAATADERSSHARACPESANRLQLILTAVTNHCS